LCRPIGVRVSKFQSFLGPGAQAPVHGARSYRRSAANPPAAAIAAVDRRDGQTDRRTYARPLYRPCSAYCAGNVNNLTNIDVRKCFYVFLYSCHLLPHFEHVFKKKIFWRLYFFNKYYVLFLINLHSPTKSNANSTQIFGFIFICLSFTTGHFHTRVLCKECILILCSVFSGCDCVVCDGDTTNAGVSVWL